MRFRVVALSPREFNNWLDQQLETARNVTPTAADANRPKAQPVALRTFKTNEAGITDKFEAEPLKAWLAKQAPEKGEDAALVAQGKELFLGKATCSQCHTVRGHGAAGVLGPDLTHVGARSTIAAGLIENNREQLHRWIHDPGAVKPGNKMAKGYADRGLKLTLAEETALVAYLESLK
jgi:cytochrome c oxidase subunit 2